MGRAAWAATCDTSAERTIPNSETIAPRPIGRIDIELIDPPGPVLAHYNHAPRRRRPLPTEDRLRSSSNTGPLAAFCLMALIWGYNWVVMKVAMSYSGPLEFSAWRCALGVLLLFGLLIALRVPLRPRELAKTVWLGLFQTAGFVGLVSWSLSTGAAGKNAVLAYTMPFWVILLGWPFLEERLRGWQWLALALAFVGLLLVLEVWRGDASVASSLLALAGGASWGISTIIFKRIPIRSRDELLSLTTWQMFFGCIPLIVAALLTPERADRVERDTDHRARFQRRRRDGESRRCSGSTSCIACRRRSAALARCSCRSSGWLRRGFSLASGRALPRASAWS